MKRTRLPAEQYTEVMPDWDGARYHRVSGPQVGWGRGVLARLSPRSGERILDLGCGTGRLTTEMARRPGIIAIGLDRSASMLREAADEGQSGPGHVAYVRGDGAALPFVEAFDAVFSTATFHWMADHQRLFEGIHTVLKPSGRLVAQCGGGANLERLLGRARELMAQPGYAAAFRSWSDPWNFAGVAETEARLARAGFSAIDVSLVPAPTAFPDAASFAEFISCVCVRHHLDRLTAEERPAFVAALTARAAADDPPFLLDYWRLNLSARKGSA